MKKLLMLILLVSGIQINAQSNEHKINLTIDKETIIDADIETTWQILGPQYLDVGLWATVVNHTHVTGTFNGNIPASRTCETKMGTLTETVLEYSKKDHKLSYSLVGMPKMVRYGQSTWILTPIDNNTTKVNMIMDAEVGGVLGFLMKPMMKIQMNGFMKKTVEEFKYYVENGVAHPRKVKQLNKIKRKESKS